MAGDQDTPGAPLDSTKADQIRRMVKKLLGEGKLSEVAGEKILEMIDDWHKALSKGDSVLANYIESEIPKELDGAIEAGGENVSDEEGQAADDTTEPDDSSDQGDQGDESQVDENQEGDNQEQNKEQKKQDELDKKKENQDELDKNKNKKDEADSPEKKKDSEPQQKTKEGEKPESLDKTQKPQEGPQKPTTGAEPKPTAQPGGGPNPTPTGAGPTASPVASPRPTPTPVGADPGWGPRPVDMVRGGGATAGGGGAAAAGGGAAAGGAAAGGGAAAAGGSAAAAGGVSVGWIVLIVLLVLLILLGIIGLFMTFSGKSTDIAGGSAFIPMKYTNDKDKAIALAVQQAVADGKLEFTDGSIAGDIEWKTKGEDDTPAPPDPNNKLGEPLTVEGKAGDKYMVLDRRVMATLAYLTSKWEYIRVSILYSNGPILTRREAVAKLFGVDSNTVSKFFRLFKGDASVLEEPPLDTVSAYHTGQAIGIDRIGKVSKALALACFQGRPVAVQVGWQRVVMEHTLRQYYEQMQLDATHLAQNLSTLVSIADGVTREADAKKADTTGKKTDAYAKTMIKSLGEKEGRDTVAFTAIENLIVRVGQTKSLSGLDKRAKDWFGQAHTKLITARDMIQATEGADRLMVWGKSEVKTPIEESIKLIFRAMQVANMDKWRGSIQAAVHGGQVGSIVAGAPGAIAGTIISTCKMWQGYEARQHVRQAELDLLRMPVDPTMLEMIGSDRENYEPELAVKQLIVFSPEDDLDNGPDGYDVFPKGAVTVDEGGLGFDDPLVGDGVVNDADEHFMKLPVDNGVFSKPGTIFVFRKEWPTFRKNWMVIFDVWKAEFEVMKEVFWDIPHNLWTGAGISIASNEELDKVTYRQFLHIGF